MGGFRRPKLGGNAPISPGLEMDGVTYGEKFNKLIQNRTEVLGWKNIGFASLKCRLD
jgi:hypothetical protein